MWLAIRSFSGGSADDDDDHTKTGEAPAAAPVQTSSSLPWTTAPVLAVPAGTLRLEGQVVDATHAPVGGATVRVGDRVATSESDGSFAFDNVAAGTLRVSAMRDELYGEADATVVETHADPVEVIVISGPTLVVHVHDSHGVPIAKAHVHTSERDSSSDASGLAILRSIDSGLELVTITAPGYAEADLRIEAAGRITVERDVTLARGAELSGTVVDPDGRPVPHAQVSCDDSTCESAETDDDGRWQIADVAGGPHAMVATAKHFLATAPVVVTSDGEHATAGVVLHVAHAGTISGVVVDAAGKPVAHAHVDGGSITSTDDDGQFTLDGLDAGTFDVEANNDVGASRAVRVTIERGGHASVRLELITSSLAGIVRTARGEPIERAWVTVSRVGSMSSNTLYTDENGRWDIGGVLPGTYELVVKRHRHGDTITMPVVVAPNRHVVLTLPDSVSVTGRVVVAGRPASDAGVVVTTSPDRDASTPISVDVRTARFTVTDLEPGSYGAIAMAPGFNITLVAPRAVAAGGTLDLGDIVLEPGRSVRGRVVDSDRVPVAGARVAAFSHSPLSDGLAGLADGTVASITDASGAFTLAGVPADVSRIRATTPAGALTERTLGAQESAVELVVTEPGEITGAVEPTTTSSPVLVVCDDDPSIRELVHVDAGGGFHVAALQPGHYSVSLLAFPSLASQSIVVASRREEIVRFIVPQPP